MATPGAEFATLGRRVPGKARDDTTEAELRTLERELRSIEIGQYHHSWSRWLNGLAQSL